MGPYLPRPVSRESEKARQDALASLVEARTTAARSVQKVPEIRRVIEAIRAHNQINGYGDLVKSVVLRGLSGGKRA